MSALVAGVLFDKAQTTLLQIPTTMTGAYVVPSTVTAIDPYAGSGTQLTSVTIPNTVTSIATYAFSACSKLTSVTLQGSTPPSLPASSNAFSFEATGFNIHVPNLSAYQSATGWSQYASVMVSP